MAEPLKKGERWRCPFEECGCAIEVVKSAKAPPAKKVEAPRCCCGCEMVKEKG